MRVPQLLARVSISAALVLAAASSARAQMDDARPDDGLMARPPVFQTSVPLTAPVATPRDRPLTVAMLAWAGGVTSDQVTTYQFASGYRHTLHESNILLHPLDRHPALLVTAGTALDAASGWAVYRFIGRRHPRIAMLTFAGAAAYRAYLARYNVGMMRQARTAR